MIRLREKFKKYRSRSKGLSNTPEAQKMKEKYGRKRPTAALSVPISTPEECAKVQRVRVRVAILDTFYEKLKKYDLKY